MHVTEEVIVTMKLHYLVLALASLLVAYGVVSAQEEVDRSRLRELR